MFCSISENDLDAQRVDYDFEAVHKYWKDKKTASVEKEGLADIRPMTSKWSRKAAKETQNRSESQSAGSRNTSSLVSFIVL